MNEFYLIGVAQGKPELKKSEAGTTYAQVVLTVKRPFVNKDGNNEADSLQMVMFKNVAEEAIEIIKDGSPLLVKGHINSNNYNKDGKIYFGTNLVVDRINALNELY